MQVGKRFLLIDDDSDDRELFSDTLASVDPISICHPIPDGEEALNKLASNEIGRPDMIFLDINLPVMSGWQILTELKKKDSYLIEGLIRKPSNHHILKGMLEIVLSNLDKNSVKTICDSIHHLVRTYNQGHN
ncbi:MAG: response regulator [Chitinophagaceae bacterium]|nr:MAG: response regulator [Chitinophagaceae bacterium]